MLKQKAFISLIIISLALAMTGCAAKEYPMVMHVDHADLQQICPLESRNALIQDLAAEGVQVVKLGDRLRIILPVDCFFDVEKSKFRAEKEPVLVSISKLVLLYGNASVSIEGYSDNLGYEADNLARTALEAEQVAAILWAHGVNQRHMHIRGYGSRFPIADNASMDGRCYNRRIEIKL